MIVGSEGASIFSHEIPDNLFEFHIFICSTRKGEANVTFTKIVERADLNNNIPEMDKKLTKEEALNLIDQQIQKEMTRSGRTYKEVSQELMAKMKATPKYLNQFHKDSTERKMKKIQESKNFPTSYETITQQQKRRESLKTYKMPEHVVTIRRNWGEPDEIHMRVELNEADHQRMLHFVRTEKLGSTEAYDKMVAEKKQKNDKRCH